MDIPQFSYLPHGSFSQVLSHLICYSSSEVTTQLTRESLGTRVSFDKNSTTKV